MGTSGEEGGTYEVLSEEWCCFGGTSRRSQVAMGCGE
jgi:hypothetical protein